MPQSWQTIYRNGAFISQTAFGLPEGIDVELLVQTSQITLPSIADEAAKQQFLRALAKRMQQNPIPLNAPHFSRDALHERR